MSIWDHLSLVSKETIFRKFYYFSDFCPFWKKHFLIIIPQNLNDIVIHGNDGMFPLHLTSGVTKNRFMNDSLISFLWIVIWKLSPKNGKNHWKWCIFMKMPLQMLHSSYFKCALKDLRRLFCQMDHIWGASSGLKKSPGLKMGSQ